MNIRESTITRQQAKIIADAISAHLSYLHRLKEAMFKNPELMKDPFYTLVDNAYKATHILWVHAHYLSCSGAGRPTGERKEEGESGPERTSP